MDFSTPILSNCTDDALTVGIYSTSQVTYVAGTVVWIKWNLLISNCCLISMAVPCLLHEIDNRYNLTYLMYIRDEDLIDKYMYDLMQLFTSL